MAIEFICPGCNHCRIENPEDIEDGLCTFCLQRRDFPQEPNIDGSVMGFVMLFGFSLGVLAGWLWFG